MYIALSPMLWVFCGFKSGLPIEVLKSSTLSTKGLSSHIEGRRTPL